MTREKRRKFRRNYFIKKKFQTKFIMGFVILLLLEALFITALFLNISSETLTTGYAGTHFVIEKTSRFFVVSFTIVALIITTAMALAGIIMFMLLSHRIAGPLYRFERTLEEMAGGKFSGRVNTRRRDQLEKLKEAFNVALGKMDGQFKEIKHDLKKAHDLAKKPSGEKRNQEVKEVISSIREKMEFFKTS